MKNTRFVLTMLLFGMASIAKAEIISFPLDVAGPYDFLESQTIDIDLGITFSQIDNISIDWSGEITAGFVNEQIVPGVFTISLFKTDVDTDTFAQASHRMGFSTFPAPDPFNVVQDLENWGWESFLDGATTAEVLFHSDPQQESSGGIPSAGTLNSATLLIDGTIIPEPTSFVLLGLGITVLRRRKHHRVNWGDNPTS